MAQHFDGRAHGLCLAVLPHGDPAAVFSRDALRRRLATAPADTLSSSGDEEEEATRKSVADEAAGSGSGGGGGGGSGWQLTPVAGGTTLTARLQKGAIGESLMTITAWLDCPFRVRVTELQALDITWLVTGLITCILPVADAFGAGGIEGDVWAGAGNKSGWLYVTEESSMGEAVSEQALGVCWVSIGLGQLTYKPVGAAIAIFVR